MYQVEIAQTASSGAWSFNTLVIPTGICMQIYVKAASSDTTFDITLTDEKDNVIYSTIDLGMTATGVLNHLLSLPVKGKYTVACVNSSADEAYTGRITIDDDRK